MTAPTPTPGARTLCCECQKPLTAEEIKYLGDRCDECETILHLMMERDLTFPEAKRVLVGKVVDPDRLVALEAAEAEATTLREQLAKVEAERDEALAAISKLQIGVEKLLCAAVGRAWAPAGFSIVSLIDDLVARAKAAEAETARMRAENAAPLPDGVTARTVYVDLNGREHPSVRSAVDKNESIARAERANAMLAAGATVYDAVCVWSWMDDPRPPEILRKLNKDTPLIISYWQCRDTPGYTVCHFEDDGYYVYVGGDAGSWSGPYGARVSLADVARFAADTLCKHPELAADRAALSQIQNEGGSRG